jgi:hypothetical protein
MMPRGKARSGDGALRGLLHDIAQRGRLLAQRQGHTDLRRRAGHGLRARLKEHFADDVLEWDADPGRGLEQGRRRRDDRAGGRGVLPGVSDGVVVAQSLSARLQEGGLQIVGQGRQAHATGAAYGGTDGAAHRKARARAA